MVHGWRPLHRNIFVTMLIGGYRRYDGDDDDDDDDDGDDYDDSSLTCGLNFVDSDT
jgi:hypothetical protein